MGRERTEGERRAAEEFANAVRTEAERFFDAVLEEVLRNPEGIRLRPTGPLPLAEEQADALALAAVHRDREEHPIEAEESAPSEDEVKAWVNRREQERRYGVTPRAWNPTSSR